MLNKKYKISIIPSSVNYGLDDYLNDQLKKGYKLYLIILNVAIFKLIKHKDNGHYFVSKEKFKNDDKINRILSNSFFNLYYTKSKKKVILTTLRPLIKTFN